MHENASGVYAIFINQGVLTARASNGAQKRTSCTVVYTRISDTSRAFQKLMDDLINAAREFLTRSVLLHVFGPENFCRDKSAQHKRVINAVPAMDSDAWPEGKLLTLWP